jgi:hypothetical protein
MFEILVIFGEIMPKYRIERDLSGLLEEFKFDDPPAQNSTRYGL